MKKLLFTLLLAAATLPGWAADWFINGDATPMDWTDNEDKHRVTAFIQQGEGTYVWIGKLVKGSEGFKIGQGFTGWGDYHPSSAGLLINEVGTDNIVSGGSDTKWKVSADGVYKLTITEGNPNTLKCEAYTPSITQDSEGYYLLGSAADLFEFAELVSHEGISADAKAKLTADIDYTDYPRSTIGRHRDIAWAGTFDGQGHKITIKLHDWMGRTGLFSYVYHPTIKNLWVDGTIDMGNHNCAGGLGGRCDGDGTRIDGVLVTVTINDSQSGDGTHGGLFANIENNYVTISNCAFLGKINAPNRNGNGGLVGWCGSGHNITFKNCLIAPESISWNGGAIVGRNAPTVTNCYYYNISNNGDFGWAAGSSLYSATLDQLKSGEICYRLNGNQKSIKWYQTINTDNYPVSFSSGHSRVYASGDLECGIYLKDGVTYSYSNSGSITPSHTNSDGYCTVCSDYVENGISATDGWFEIVNAKQLRWMAESVNEYNGTYGNANIKLTADIDYSTYTDQAAMFGKPSNTYKGTFDGQCHTVTVAFNNTSSHEYEEAGLFRRINGGTVKNLKVAGTITTNKKLAGGICSGIWQRGTITNCESAVTITDTESGDGTHGGILAATHDENDNDNIYVLNCLFSGTLNASSRTGSAGIVGWTSNRNTVKVKNCLVTGTFDIADSSDNGVIVRSTCDGENNYYTCSAGTNLQKYYATEASAKKGTGELCYLLNESTSAGTNWTQTIDTDDNPVPFNTRSLVYANGEYQCDGVTPKTGGTTTYANTESRSVDEHNFGANNLCSVCYAVGQEPTTSDSKYQIGTIGHLVWFSNHVNSGNTTANAVLTANIDQEVSSGVYAVYVPIGNEENVYTGHFDGQGHTVNLHIDSDKNFQGLFGVVTDGVFIEKVIVKGSVSGHNYVGGIVGGTRGGSNNARQTNIWYCGNEATITATNANAGGIIGVNMNGSASIILTNCYNTGNITSGSDGGALSGWLGGGWSSVRNCYNSGVLAIGEASGTAFGRNNGCRFTNCYYKQSSGTSTDGNPTMVADSEVASGALCAKLGFGFRQNLSGAEADTYPSFNFDHGFVAQIGEAGYSTMYNIHSDVTIPDGIEAYAGVVKGDNLSLEAIENKIAASEPVILKLAEGTDAGLFNFMPTTGATPATSNSLSGSNGDVTGNGSTIFALANGSNGVGFYCVDNGIVIPEGKAYLIDTTGSSVKGFTFVFDDDATAIEETLSNSPLKGENIYNLAGQRVGKMQKGINIVNRKKVMVK